MFWRGCFCGILVLMGIAGCRNDASLSGGKFYEKYCADCHGINGDGQGRKTATLPVKPFDLRDGKFKFRTTPFGSLPTDEDILRTLSHGSTHEGIAGWEKLPHENRRAVIEYLKTFSPRWQTDAPPKPRVLPPTPPYVGSSESVAAGKALYRVGQCWQCHGYDGRGDGTTAYSLTDDWGNPILPADFAAGFKRGNLPGDVFATLTTGLNGTPMPSYVEVFSDEERWHLTSYALFLASEAAASE